MSSIPVEVDMTLRLREERQRRDWSLVDVTMRTGISSADLSLVERGLKPAFPGWRRRIAKAFNMPESELFREVKGDS